MNITQKVKDLAELLRSAKDGQGVNWNVKNLSKDEIEKLTVIITDPLGEIGSAIINGLTLVEDNDDSILLLLDNGMEFWFTTDPLIFREEDLDRHSYYYQAGEIGNFYDTLVDVVKRGIAQG